jgi:pimeloyl-ACP methyl ester carboxylesterase
MILVIIPGWRQTSAEWSILKSKISQDMKTFIIDLPGFGVEPLVSQEWDVIDYSDWVTKIIVNNFQNQEICLLGHSFGGKLACEIASKQPNWLSKLILISSPLIYRPTVKTKFLKSLSKVTPSIIKKKYNKFSSDDYRNVKGTELEKVFKKTIVYDQEKQLDSINVETTIIWGEKDKYVPLEIGVEINCKIRNSTIEILPNCGHNIHLTNPNLLYSTILRHVKNY